MLASSVEGAVWSRTLSRGLPVVGTWGMLASSVEGEVCILF